MSTAIVNQYDSLLPWDNLPSDERRQRRITVLMLLLALIFSVAIPFIKVPKESRADSEAVPERIARVIERKVELPPPPPPKPKEEEKPKEEPKPEEKLEQPKEAPKPVEVTKAREKATQMLKDSGIDELANLRDSFDLPTPSGGLITSTEAAGTSRSLLTSKAGSGSGVGVAGYGGQMSSGLGGKPAGKGTADVLGSGGGKELQAVKSNINTSAVAAGNVKVGKDGKARRTQENITKGFDRYGARLNNLYQRALRDDPNMQGTVTIKLTISPDGAVTDASIASSQLGNADLESKILALVRGFSFGAENVETWTGSHTLNFYAN